jgi:hypothetical protein
MLQIELSELVKHPVLLGLPQYGGQCSTIFARSLGDIMLLAGQHGLPFGTAFIWNEAFITRARNHIADVFLKSPAEHLMFIDSDIGFNAQDVIELLILQIKNPEYNLIAAPYKKKALDAGYAFDYGGQTLTVNAATRDKGPIEVRGTGNGFMMVHRSVFERFAEAYPHYCYTSDDGQPRAMMQFFQAEIDKVSNRYLSEDYWFQDRCRDIGIKTWLCPWMKLRHAGMHIFE